MTYSPKVGDRVRITDVVDVEVKEVKSGHIITTEGGRYENVFHSGAWARSFEKIGPPEPQWRDGDVVGSLAPSLPTTGRVDDVVFAAQALIPGALWYWNDIPGRTVEEVLDLFERAAAAAEERDD